MDSQALPPGIGPKICPFPDRRAEISFLDLLNPGENPRSYVFKVRINGRIYALKIFDDFDIRYETIGFINHEFPDETIRFHAAPFFRECRAYGRLQEHGLDGVYTAPCYGHLEISAGRISQLLTQFDSIDSWGGKGNPHKQQPYRAIVKGFLDKGIQSDHAACKEDIETLEAINKLGISVGNVESDNLLNGIVTSFGRSETTPYYKNGIRGEGELKYALFGDLIEYQSRLEAEGNNSLQTWPRE